MTAKPRGKSAVRAALMQAAGIMLSRHGITGVSVRDIAQEAKVNHGLIHRHFGSKDRLVQETVQSLSDRIAGQLGPAAPDESLSDLLRNTMNATETQSHYYRILAFLMLTDGGEELIQSDFPVVRRMLKAVEREPNRMLSTKATIVMLLSLGLGLMIFEPYLRRAAKLSDAEFQSIRMELGRWASQLVRG